MTARTVTGGSLSAGLHLLAAAMLWLGYATRDDTKAVARSLVIVQDPDEQAALPAASARRSAGSEASLASTDLSTTLSHAIRQSRATRTAALADQAEQETITAVAEARPTPTSLRPKITKEAFDRQGSGPPLPHAPAARIPRIDGERLARELREAGGVAADALQPAAGAGTLLPSYREQVEARMKALLDARPGMNAGLSVAVELRIRDGGTVGEVRIVRSSGDPAFDALVRHALLTLQLPPRPASVAERQIFSIRSVP